MFCRIIYFIMVGNHIFLHGCIQSNGIMIHGISKACREVTFMAGFLYLKTVEREADGSV